MDDTRYEFIAMMKDSRDGTWFKVGSASDQSINDVAGLIQCPDHSPFSYTCPICMGNRDFLKTLQASEAVTRVEMNEYGKWTMEIAHVTGTEYMA